MVKQVTHSYMKRRRLNKERSVNYKYIRRSDVNAGEAAISETE